MQEMLGVDEPDRYVACPSCGAIVGIYDFVAWDEHPEPWCTWFGDSPSNEVHAALVEHHQLVTARHGGSA